MLGLRYKNRLLMLLMEMTTAYVSRHKHTFMYCVGKMRNFSVFMQLHCIMKGKNKAL
jgi:hypothetical protein